MPDHKAKIVMAEEVWNIIRWFTYNFPTEIGALGIVKQRKRDGEKYFYVEELLFPKQKVTGATIHFTPEMWGELLKERGLDGLKNVAFYWHRHPGNSAHSGTDDEDTFETFMSKEAGRKYFLFLQTAVSTAGWNQEARIDIRLPIRHTILDNDIDIRIEKSPEDDKLRKKCEKIAKKCIIEEEIITTPRPDNRNYQNRHSSQQNLNYWNKFSGDVRKINGDLETAIKKNRFGFIEDTTHLNNDLLDGHITSVEEKVSVTFENGQATIICGKNFGIILEKSMKEKKGKLPSLVRRYKTNKSNTKGMKQYNLQPTKGKYQEMKDNIIKGYLIYNDSLLISIDVEFPPKPLDESEKKGLELLFDSTKKDLSNKDFVFVAGLKPVNEVVDLLEFECDVNWINVYQAIVFDIDRERKIGDLWINFEKDTLQIHGSEIIDILQHEKEIESNYNTEREKNEEEE